MNYQLKTDFVALDGVEPSSERYECSVLTVELQSLKNGVKVRRRKSFYSIPKKRH